VPLFTQMPRRGILGNWVSGVRNSRKPNLFHYSFLKSLYVGAILYVADWGYARIHERLSGVEAFSETGNLRLSLRDEKRRSARSEVLKVLRRGPPF
jgi:hypothetical protein